MDGLSAKALASAGGNYPLPFYPAPPKGLDLKSGLSSQLQFLNKKLGLGDYPLTLILLKFKGPNGIISECAFVTSRLGGIVARNLKSDEVYMINISRGVF